MQLIEHYPEFLRESESFAKIQQAMNGEVQKLRDNLQDLLKQCFVESATWGLALWERQVGIAPDDTKETAARKAAVIARLQAPATTTVSRIKEIAESYADRTAAVIEHYADYSFTIRFSEKKGIPEKQKELERVIEEIKPAHLGVSYEFLYTIHQELKPWTHGQLHAWTHEGIRTEDSI